MRYLLLSSALLLAGIVTVVSAKTPVHAQTIKRTVYLNHVVLEEMQKANPERYSRVKRIMAAASELCAPNAARQWAALDVKSASCSGTVLKMSFPAKREIGFELDDTWYIGLVTVREKYPLQSPPPGTIVPADLQPTPK